MYQSQGTETGTLIAQNMKLQVRRLGLAIVAHNIHYVLQELCKFFPLYYWYVSTNCFVLSFLCKSSGYNLVVAMFSSATVNAGRKALVCAKIHSRNQCNPEELCGRTGCVLTYGVLLSLASGRHHQALALAAGFPIGCGLP